MIRKVSFKFNTEWRLGVIHTFTDSKAVVEDAETGELHLIAVCPENLKFECKVEEFTKMQQEAQARAMAQQVVAVPPNARYRG